MIVTWTGGYLLNLGRPGLDQEVEGGGDEGEADVLHHLGLVRRHRDRPLLQVHLRTTTLDTLEICTGCFQVICKSKSMIVSFNS